MSDSRFCSQCGTASSPSDRFCGACGSELGITSEGPAVGSPVEPSPEEEAGSRFSLSDLFWLAVGAFLLINYGPSLYRSLTGTGSSNLWDDSNVNVEVSDCGTYYGVDDQTPATGVIENDRSKPVMVYVEIGWYEDGVKIDDSNTNVRVRANGTARFTTNGGSRDPFDECLIDDIKVY